jgi:hypothetical protein
MPNAATSMLRSRLSSTSSSVIISGGAKTPISVSQPSCVVQPSRTSVRGDSSMDPVGFAAREYHRSPC